MITIKFIPHKEQRYDTAGDYWMIKDNLQIRISDMKDWRYSYLVLIHELVEIFLCRLAGVNYKDIDAFDLSYKGVDPGLSKGAPYHKQHMFAMVVERMMSKVMKVKWREYNKVLDNLKWRKDD
jgi:hypothetical protein